MNFGRDPEVNFNHRVEEFRAEYLRQHTEADMQRFLQVNEGLRLPWFLGSIDCQHW